jgi:tape measure domain-containing protein
LTDVTSRLRLVVDSTGVEKAQRKLRDLRKDARDVDAAVAGLKSAFGSLALAIGSAFAVSEVLRYADTWKQVENQLKTVEKSVGAVRAAQQGVFDIAQRTFATYEGTANLYVRLTRAGQGYIKSQQEALRLTETVNKAIAVGGASTAEQNSAVLQLGQALGSGKLAGDELRSLGENAPLLVKAIADSMGVARGAIKQLGADGKITTEVVIKALREVGDQMDETFSKLEPTIGQALTTVKNSFTKLIGEGGSGLFSGIAQGLIFVGQHLETVAKLATVAGSVLAVVFGGKLLAGAWAMVAPLIALERALGATSTAAAIQSVALKGLQGAWRGLTVAMASNPLGLIAVAVTAATVALYEFGDRMQVETGKFATQLKGIKGELLEYEVTVRDVMRAIPSVIGDALQGAVDSLGGWIQGIVGPVQMAEFSAFFDTVGQVAHQGFNLMASAGVAAYQTILKNWRLFPAALGDLVASGVNAAIGAIEGLVNRAVDGLNDLIRKANDTAKSVGLAVSLPELGRVQFGRVANEWSGTLASIGQDFTAFQKIASNTDWAAKSGDAFKAITDRAREFAKARAEAAALARAGAEGVDLTNPAAAAAAGAGGVDKALQKIADQARDLEEMFAALRADAALAQRALSEGWSLGELDRELDILREADRLLGSKRDLYEAQARAQLGLAASSEQVAQLAGQKAAADARSAQALDDQTRSTRMLVGVYEELNDVGKLTAALRISSQEYEMQKQILDIKRQFPGIEDARAQSAAETLVLIERQTDELERQASRAKELTEAPLKNLITSLEGASDDFWTNWVEKGTGAFKDLGDALKRTLRQLQADLLRKAFEPFLNKIKDALGLGVAVPKVDIQAAQVIVNGQSAGGGSGGSGILGELGSIFGSAGSDTLGGGAGDDTLGGGRGGFNIGSILGSIGKGGGGLGSILGSVGGLGGLGGGSGSGGISSILGQVGQSLAYAQLGSGIASMLGLTGKNAGIGGTIGGIAGSFFGPIGSAVGSFLGQALGSIIGPAPTNAAAGVPISSSGVLGAVTGDKRTADTEAATLQAAQRVVEGQKLLREMGATLAVTASGVSLGVRDLGQYALRNEATGAITGGRSNAVGNPEELAQFVLGKVLASAEFASPVLNKVAAAMSSAGKSFDDTLTVLGALADLLPQSGEALSEWGQALKSLNDTFASLREQTAGVAAATAEVDAAYGLAKNALRDSFEKSITDAIREAEAPLQARLGELLTIQSQRYADAQTLGGNLADVLRLNKIEIEGFITEAMSGAGAFADLNAAFASARAEAVGLGRDVAQMDAAFASARASVAATFNSDVADQIAQRTTPALANLRKLLKEQEARLAQASALGADLAQVERLTSLELSEFFKGLSDDALKEVEGFLGLFDQATNRVVANLDLSRQDLQGRADSFGQFAQQFSDLNADLTERFIAASPRESLGLLRGRVGDLLAGVQGGNADAAQSLPDAVNKLVEAARASFGNTTQFSEVLAYAQSALSQAEQSALGIQTDTERQIAALDESNNILADIREILSSSQATNAFFQSYINGGIASSDSLMQMIQQGAGLTAANDNMSALSITSLIAQTVQPALAPVATSLDTFTARLSNLPTLQQLTIEAINRGADRITLAIESVESRLDRIELLQKKQLLELEQQAA